MITEQKQPAQRADLCELVQERFGQLLGIARRPGRSGDEVVRAHPPEEHQRIAIYLEELGGGDPCVVGTEQVAASRRQPRRHCRPVELLLWRTEAEDRPADQLAEVPLGQLQPGALLIPRGAAQHSMVLAVGAHLGVLGDRAREAPVPEGDVGCEIERRPDSGGAERVQRMLGVRELVLDVLGDHGRRAETSRPWLDLHDRRAGCP